jgi:predicted CoA-binding protein
MVLTQDADLRQILEQSKTIAVVGWSNKPDRPSNRIARRLVSFGYEVYHVNPTIASTPEQPVYASLADIPVKIDVVDVFRRAEDVPEVVEDAIAVGAKAVWMQQGIINEEAGKQAEAAGLKVVMDRCMNDEYVRLIERQ